MYKDSLVVKYIFFYLHKMAYMRTRKEKIVYIGKNVAVVPISEIKKCGRFDAKHYISGEHERICKGRKSRRYG